ncbi:hypothetical protein H2200_013153 [Cladophialophora chaetospira]|uniref:BZIP domain-containing protein n=1 Tax=Cladophialophora chaetospira TaxID=386627 RepID=A0AA39CBG3_9EURO|nr:hypothetical protein H2200_013153 [Cladophialophora chaetospira]
MDNIRYTHFKTPANEALFASYGRQLRVLDTTKAPSAPQHEHIPTEVVNQPDTIDSAWPSAHDQSSMRIPHMAHIEYTSSVDWSLQDFMVAAKKTSLLDRADVCQELSPCSSLMEFGTLSPAQEESPLEWMPINDASDPHPQNGSKNSQRSSSKPRGGKRSIEAIERRKHQNRRAQQAFRARRKERQEQLRAQIIDLKHQHAETLRETEELHKELNQLKEQNSLLKKCIQSSFASTNNDFSFSLPWQT